MLSSRTSTPSVWVLNGDDGTEVFVGVLQCHYGSVVEVLYHRIMRRENCCLTEAIRSLWES